MFSPIAIVGRACVLPGAHSPEALWDAVLEGRDLLSTVPADRWRGRLRDLLCAPDDPRDDRSWSDQGGYVTGLQDLWDPTGFQTPAAQLDGLDRLDKLVLHTARAALADANTSLGRTHAIFGNLGYPSASMTRWVEAAHAGAALPDPRTRFMSGGAADRLRDALGLESSFCLDTACASSLYAIKLACDALHDDRADAALAGAVSAADDLFIHVGFCALQAMSRSGRSRPFHADADGLVPAEGAGFVVLKRLADAQRDGDTIHGVIRGVGLSNDGRGRGFLAPAEEGQARAMQAAYAMSGLEPSDISLLECHATGTSVGDATEIRSSAAVFAGAADVPLGSLKGNLGHLITAAGVAGLIKVLEAMRHGVRPPNRPVDALNPDLAGSPFRLLQAPEPWTGRRVAGISAFGFGGNNGHLIVESEPTGSPATSAARTPVPLAIVGVGAVVGSAATAAAFGDVVCSGGSLLTDGAARTEAVTLDLAGLRFPPKDLHDTLGQQLVVLAAAREATTGLDLPRDRTGVFLAMEPDVTVARYGTRWRLPERLREAGQDPADHGPWLADARDGVVPALTSAGVVGRMPNIPTNRINSALDIAGPGITVSEGEASGGRALDLAVRALESGELDVALVCAVDLSCAPEHAAAVDALDGAPSVPGDAAVVLVLRRAAPGDGPHVTLQRTTRGVPIGLDARFGRSWAAGELRDLAATALALAVGADPTGRPLLGERHQDVALRCGAAVRLTAPTDAPAIRGPRLHRFGAATPEALLAALRSGSEGGDGPCRAVLVATDAAQRADRIQRARAAITEGRTPGPGVYVRLRPIVGETAFVFGGAGAAYAGQGRALLRALPELRAALADHPELASAYDAPWADDHAPELQRLWSSAAMTALHDHLARQVLGLRPDAVIGYSSGESNSLFSTGVWSDPDAMIREANASGLFTERIGGRFDVIEAAWGTRGWETWVVLAPLAEVEAAVADEPHASVSVIHTDRDCIVAGDPAACGRALDRLGRSRCLRLRYDLAVHVPELAAVSEEWLALHRRPVTPQPVRVYSAGLGRSYTPSMEACAEAILAQADRTLDFRGVIEAAWADGVRVFVEHGPQGSCARWIRAILGPDRDAVVVSLDRKGAGVEALFDAIAALLAAGVSVDTALLDRRVSAAAPPEARRPMRFPAHPPAVRLPPLPEVVMQPMPPAPSLPWIALDGLSVPPLPAPAAAPPPVAHPQVPSAPALSVHPAAAALQRTLAELGATQQAFIGQQAALHQRFLETQRNALATLGAHPALRGHDAPRSAPLPAASIPAAPVPTPSIPAAPAPLPVPAPVARPRPVAPASSAPTLGTPIGPTFSRADLVVHSGGQISSIFGEQFAVQDGYARQVRMPEPPLLLADRVTGIDAAPGSMSTGTIWTETDVTADSWYLHHGHMPTGVLIEAGQADLMLISWLGVDFTNRGDRVYRLLGCELTLHGPLPSPGETLQYAIHLDGHAAQGDIRLMFFHYDGFVDGVRRISVRRGQAGFFTDAELADSDGCLWTPEAQEIVADPRLADPLVVCTKSSFSADAVRAFADGRPWECFGPGFERTQTHTRTPRIQGGRMLFLDGGVDVFAPRGGPWGRGFLEASVAIRPDHWFFEGHFKNDPCMPGTLMFEGCLQAMAFFLAGLGFTTDSDGYVFEPTTEAPFQLHCRGQVTPTSKRLVYQVFVEELVGGPEPVLYADLLCTVDGLKAFHARRVGLRLRPGWPLDEGSALLDPATDTGWSGVAPERDVPVAEADGFRFDQRSLIACANGRPSEAFGPMYAPFDSSTRVARLPNPPYHFISRATDTVGPIGSMQEGLGVTMEYDIPADAWYFDANGCRVMPYAVLLEAALQPCGWLASYTGCALTSDRELFFRNLDGTSTLHVDLLTTAGTLRTVVRNTGISKMGPMIIVNYEVECFVEDTLVYDMTTVFGFFPAEALANQVGLPTRPEQRAQLEDPSSFLVDLTARPAGCWDAGRPHLAEPMLLMLDRVTAFDPTGGSAGLGFARAEKDVDVGEWFFKAHFFQDPVQPGSLGIEAMIQLLQWWMLETGMDAGVQSPRFEGIATGTPMTWKYRGQVIPTNSVIGTTLEITEAGTDDAGPYAVASASLWVDGKRIYEASGLGMRIVSGGVPERPAVVLDPIEDPWLLDHCPTFTRPALPMLSIVDLLASGAPVSDPVIGLRGVTLSGWLDVGERRELRIERSGTQITLVDGDRVLASAEVLSGSYPARPAAFPPLHGPPAELPYATGALFHGPAFQVLERLVRTPEGASSTLRATSGVPIGVLNPALLDGATHGIPHDALHTWFPALGDDVVAYPALIPELSVHGPTPTEGTLRCEVRPDGFFGTQQFPAFRVQLIDASGVWVAFRLVEACFPKGRLGAADPADRRAFLGERRFVPGLALSVQDGRETVLATADVAATDWLPGTVAGVYGTDEPAEIATREHIARAHGIHPGTLPGGLPLTRFDLAVSATRAETRVTGDGRGALDITPITQFWDAWFGVGRWPVEDLYYGLIERFVGRVVLEDPDAFAAARGRSALFLANHQTGVESLLFSVLASGLTGVPTVTLAKAEHRATWLGQLIAHCFSYPGVRDPKLITFFDRDDRASLPAVMGELAAEMAQGGRSVMVHVEGTRSLECRTPVQKMSGGFLDMALAVGAPVIPVRFIGGLPVDPLQTRLEFPVGMGRQDIWFGRPIEPDALAALHYGARKELVLDAINGLGPSNGEESPLPGDPAFAAEVTAWQDRRGVSHEHAALRCVLAACVSPTEATRRLLGGADLSGDAPEAAWLRELDQRLNGDDHVG